MIWEQNQQPFFKNPIHRVSFRLQNRNAVTYFLTICKRYDCLMIIWKRTVIADIKHARLRKRNLPNCMFPQRSMFKCNRNVVLEHPDNHCPVLRGLAFQMVYMSTNPDNGVRDHGSVLFVMFISQLFKVFLFAVRSMENFVDQRNEKLRHFLRNGSEYIVENRAVFCCVFCVGIWQRSCQNVSVPHVVSYLSFSIYHKHLLLQYKKYKKQSCYDQFYEIVVLMEIYERNALHEW